MPFTATLASQGTRGGVGRWGRRGGPFTRRPRGLIAPSSSSDSSSRRQPKDPSSYSSIEDVRRELEISRGMAPFSLTKAIQWIGDSINAGGSRSLLFSAYSWVLGLDQPLSWSKSGETPEEELAALDAVAERLEASGADISQLEVILLLPRQSVLKLVRRCPALERLSGGDLMIRMMDLKLLFPENNVARMIELVPGGFLSQDWAVTKARLEGVYCVLRTPYCVLNIDHSITHSTTRFLDHPLTRSFARQQRPPRSSGTDSRVQTSTPSSRKTRPSSSRTPRVCGTGFSKWKSCGASTRPSSRTRGPTSWPSPCVRWATRARQTRSTRSGQNNGRILI